MAKSGGRREFSTFVGLFRDGRYSFFVFDPVGRVYLDPRDPLDDPAHEPPVEEPRSASVENT